MTMVNSANIVGIVVNVNAATEKVAVDMLDAYLSALVRLCVGAELYPQEADLSPTVPYEKKFVKAVGLNVLVRMPELADEFSANFESTNQVQALVRDGLTPYLDAVCAERGISVERLKAVYNGLDDMERPVFPCAEIGLVRQTYE